MNHHRYTLQKYNGPATRHRCPACKENKTFTYYIDTETNDPLHSSVGRCNREVKCGYHFKPRDFFLTNPQVKDYASLWQITKPVVAPLKQPSFIDKMHFDASMKGYQHNNFITFLTRTFGKEITGELIFRYGIGTSSHWPGATVFWQIDTCGKLRTGKIMLYNPETGKRVRQPFNHISWMHTRLNKHDFELKQCFFGEHLLCDTQKTIGIVESEKTAVIASAYYPHRIWLASGSLSNLTRQKFEVLRGRNVVLYPDVNGFIKWYDKLNELYDIANVSINEMLEYKASDDDFKNGLDLADYLLRFDYQWFKKRAEGSLIY
jgi:hypothetical protein